MDRIGLKQQFRKRTMEGVDGCKGPSRPTFRYQISRMWSPLRPGQRKIQRQRLLRRLQNQNRGQGKSKQDQKRGEASSKDHRQQQHRHNSISPCFIPYLIGHNGQEIMSCTSPFDRRSYTLGCVPWRQRTVVCQSGACHPWIIVLHLDFSRVALLNPISGHEITLPGSPISWSDYEFGAPRFVLSLSHSHSSTPFYTVFIIFDSSKLLLFRKGDHVWTRLNLSWDLNSFNTFKGDLYALRTPEGPRRASEGTRRASEGARYLLAVYTYATEPIPTTEPFGYHWIGSPNDEENQPTPDIEKFVMDTSQLPSPDIHEFFVHHLVESPNGEELLLVLEIIDIGRRFGELTFLTLGFQVFTADLSGMMWIRKETLGDHVLIIQGRQTLFLSAASVGHGVKGNCIFFSKETEKTALKMFDLDSEKVTDCPFSIPFNAGQFMFTPSIC